MGVKDITTLSKSVIYTTGCLDFAKRFVCACGEQDFSPISSRMQRTLLHSVAALVFSKVQSIVGRLPLYLTYRLRGASYRVFGAADRLKSKRWRRHFLCMFWLPYPSIFCWLSGIADRRGAGCFEGFHSREVTSKRVFSKRNRWSSP